MAALLPSLVFKLLAGLLKYRARDWMGEAFADTVGDALADAGTEEAQRRVEQWLCREETVRRLLKAARHADAYFQ